jgi:hypothetical protein
MTFVWFQVLPFILSMSAYPWLGIKGFLFFQAVGFFCYLKRYQLLFLILKAKQLIVFERRFHHHLKFSSTRFGIKPIQLWHSSMLQTPVCFHGQDKTFIIFNAEIMEQMPEEIFCAWLITEINSIKSKVDQARFMLLFHQCLMNLLKSLHIPLSQYLPTKWTSSIQYIFDLELNFVNNILTRLFWNQFKTVSWKEQNQLFAKEVLLWRDWLRSVHLDEKLNQPYPQVIDV